jgi:hypothetical protein
MPPGPPREHDPRITVIQHELFNEKRSKADKYRELVVGPPGVGARGGNEVGRVGAPRGPGAAGGVRRAKRKPRGGGQLGRDLGVGV